MEAQDQLPLLLSAQQLQRQTFQIINVLSLMVLKKYKYIENVYKSNSCGFVLPYYLLVYLLSF